MVKPGQPVRLVDFRLTICDQEVKGIVVDPRGKPLSGIVVDYDRDDHASEFDPPAGGVWFQDSGANGRFHLTSLPRGPIKLKVDREPDGADRQIKDMRYVDVRPGQSEVRIEMPDANDRLRGIE